MFPMRTISNVARIAEAALFSSALVVLAACMPKHDGNAASESYDPGAPAAEGYDPSASATTAPPYTEADRTYQMEQGAADLNQQFADAQEGNLSPEEAEQAYQEFEKKRLELNRIGEQGSQGGGSYPPPPR